MEFRIDFGEEPNFEPPQNIVMTPELFDATIHGDYAPYSAEDMEVSFGSGEAKNGFGYQGAPEDDTAVIAYLWELSQAVGYAIVEIVAHIDCHDVEEGSELQTDLYSQLYFTKLYLCRVERALDERMAFVDVSSSLDERMSVSS